MKLNELNHSDLLLIENVLQSIPTDGKEDDALALWVKIKKFRQEISYPPAVVDKEQNKPIGIN